MLGPKGAVAVRSLPMPTSSVPAVSVGLPTYNRSAGLRRAAESVLAQTWTDLELVISDNASDDETRAVCEELAGRDSRVRVVRHEANMGAEANFRCVLEQATGTFFMWLADDDWLETGTVAACAQRLIERPDHALVCASSRYFRDGEPAFVERPVDLLQSSAGARVIGFYRTVTLNGPFYGLTRREQLLLLPPLRTTLAADWLHVASLAKLGKVATVREVAINRSLGGVSKDEASLARAYGLSPREARNWQLAVARAVYRDIAHGRVFSTLPRLQRRLLATSAAVLVAVRFSWKVWLGRALQRAGLFERARTILERRR
jgi:glycosyltransferase involved in cell wall biosynthesis